MEIEIKEFTVRLVSGSLSDENIIEEKLKKFENLDERRLTVLLNHQFFAGQNRLTAYLSKALQEDPRHSQPIRKRLYQFISNHIRTQYLSLIDHVKNLFAQMLSQFWREEGKLKQYSIEPIAAIIEAYDENFLVTNDIVKPQKLHEDIKTMLQTQKKSHGVIGQCWYLMAVIQSKFPHVIGPTNKKKVQQMMFVELKQYVGTEKNLSTIAALLRGLSKALRQSYFTENLVEELFSYMIVLIVPVKATYAVHLAALQLLSQRRELFHHYIMLQAGKLFSILREGANHKNKEYKMKSLEVLIEVCEELVKGISTNKQKYKHIFVYIQKQIGEDIKLATSRDRGEVISQEKRGLGLLTVVRLLGIISPLYLHYEGIEEYRKMFDYIIKKCTKKIIKENNFSASSPSSKGYDIKYVLYAQKELNSFVLSLSRLVEHLDQIQYGAANQLEQIFISAVKESKYFLPKYEPDLWQALIQLIMSIHLKGAIFAKWSKKVISESLKECLDSKKMGVENDDEFIKMIERASHLWRSILAHTSWRTGPLHEFTQNLLSNIEYLLLNLNCGYRIRGEQREEQLSENQSSQQEDIVQIFYLANERIEISKIEDYQYLSSLSLLFHQILDCIDPSLYNQKISNFYPQILQRIKLYPKCLPLLRTLRSLNEYILKNRFFKQYLNSQVQYARELVEKMVKFFNHTIEIVFKFQEQYFYQLLKVLLSFSQQVYFADSHRIIKHHLPNLLIKTFEMGQEVVSLANAALKCISRLFTSERQISERYLLPVISSLQKYINLVTNSERQEFKSQLFLFELSITREKLSNTVLSFLGSLGGLCHQLVDNKNKDHISWDYDCKLEVEINILNEKLSLNLSRMLNRICWLSVNGKDQIKIVACQLLHAKITYVIEQIVSNKMDKATLSTFLDRVLPTILSISSNTSHPSQQLIHTLLIQVIHFFANTKEPNSPDVQVILKHLLSLYNKSQDMGFIASKCLSEFIRWHIKQQPQKNGDVPILKALMSNIWSLVGNKNAREGIVNFLIKLLKIIYRQSEIMRYYSIELGSLLISLARYHHKLQPQFKYLLEKYTSCIKRYMKYLIIPEGGRRYKKTPTVHAFLEELYRTFFSIYQQQREASFVIWLRILKENQDQLGYTEVKFLKDRAQKQKKYLFGGSLPLDFKNIDEGEFGKNCWKLIALGEIWLKMLEEKIFVENNLIQFLDLECVYLVSFVSLILYIHHAQQSGTNSWSEEIQESIVSNFKTFLRMIRSFNLENSSLLLGKFHFNLYQNNLTQSHLQNCLFSLVFKPDSFIKNFNKDLLSGKDLKLYLENFIHYFQVKDIEESRKPTPIERAFFFLSNELKFNVEKIVDYFCFDETASERMILSIMEFIKTAYYYEMEYNLSRGENNSLKTLISKLLNQYQKGKPQRQHNIVNFVLNYSYSISQKFISFQFQSNSAIFQKYEKYFIQFIVKNWSLMDKTIIKISLSSITNIKINYILLMKLSPQQKEKYIQSLYQQQISQLLLRDLLKLNFLLTKQLNFYPQMYEQENKQTIRQKYMTYLQKLVDQGLSKGHPIEIHEQALHLCGIIINKKLRVSNNIMKTLKGVFPMMGTKYVPILISGLDNPEKQEIAMKYFNIMRNFIVISEEFEFIDQFFIVIKDFDLNQNKKQIINNYIEDCVRTCFSLDNQRPLEWAELLLSYYWDEDIDKDQWRNFRLLIIQRIFRKAVTYIKLEYLYVLYDKYILDLQKILKKSLCSDSLRSLMVDMQAKCGGFLLVQLLYGNLPRREKKQGVKSENEIHKTFIKYAMDIAKRNLDESLMRMINEHDLKPGQTKKARNIYKQYNCYAYNCLIVLFISTQSNKEHFKTFLFEHNKQALWNNFVDTDQQQFGFQIQTNFRVIQPYTPLRNKIKEIKSKIEKNYFESSLYVVQEQNIPLGYLAQIAEQNEDEEEKEVVPIKNAHNVMLNTVIQQDIINKHPCMMNLLRVVDFLNANFPEVYPGWMKPIQAYLTSPVIKLPEIILILKLILNRPNVFNQAEVWSKHLLNYLSFTKTGSKFIHYFYRDALKRFLKFLPELVNVKPDINKINIVVMKIVKSLPHDNVRVFSDNIDMLEELLRIPGVYVQKKTIINMLTSTKENKNDWRMCAVITLKLCITARVPILDVNEYPKLKDTPARFGYYYKDIKNQMKLVFELASQSSKQYRIAAAGFLGELLGFIFLSDLEEYQKKEHFKSVSQFLISLLEKTANRSTKEKFTLALYQISVRFPQLLADEKLFAIVEDGLFQFNGTQRYELLLSFKQFCRSLIAFNDMSKITNFFMLMRVNCQKLVSDTNEVQLVLLQILNLCTDHRLLKDRNIIYTFYLTFDKFDFLKEINEAISSEYYQLLIKLKKYLIDPQAKPFDFCPLLLAKIEEKLIEGLSNKFESTYKMLFYQFQQESANMVEPSNIFRYVKIFEKLYNKKSQGEWLINAMPIILTLCRISSDYNRLFSQTKLEENMLYYDWDFRNFKINDASLPYTPFTVFADRKREGGSQRQLPPGASQGHNLRGMIKATQYNLSQQEQIFTMLQSLSSQSQSNQNNGSLQQNEEIKESQENDRYHKINDLFMKKRRRNEVMDSFKESNMNKSSPAVQFIEDKIRFVKNYKVEGGFTKRFKKIQNKEKLKKGAILRAYKIGQLPNIQISLQHILQPLIYLSAKDNQLSSEIFSQFISKVCALSLKHCDIMKQTLCKLLLESTHFNFNFISTIQKCLIKICQKHGKFMDMSIKNVALQSNTVDYAVLFTEQNVIQLLLQGDNSNPQHVKNMKQKFMRQWYDLVEYYQILNEPDMIEALVMKITEGEYRDNITKALKKKKEGELVQAQKLINQALSESNNDRLQKFLEKEKIDCSVLLSQWEQISTDSTNKIERGEKQSSQELKMLAIAIQNIEPQKRPKLLQMFEIEGEKYEYERGILSVMKQNQMDKARYHSLNARQLFRREWERVSSFAFNSKHDLLQSLQKNYELIEFLELYKKPQANEKDCKQLFEKWSTRKPDEIFDDNITWIQILSSRAMLGTLLGDRWGIAAESMAKSNTQWLVQVVNGMVQKGVFGYAQNVIRKALYQHRLSKQFNWNFYQSISQLKLMQIIKKSSLKLQEYEIVPKLIQKQMDTHKNTSDFSKFKLITIKNEYLQGFIQVCLDKRESMDLGIFVMQVVNIFKNYEQVKKGLKNNMNNFQIQEQFHKNIHFKYAIFLENLLSIVKGKFEIKQVKEQLQRFKINTKQIAIKFIQELVYSVKLLDINKNSALNYEQGQQLFSMILKLIKIVQLQHKTIGKNFQDAISDKNIPKWIFIYFIPQIIKNINTYDISIHFKQLFDYLLANYPQALVYPFNCTYPRKSDCQTQLTNFLYDELHLKMGKYFDFINNLFLIQHPEMRLKDILTKYVYHGESDNAVVELNEFISHNPLLGKYNQRFQENNKQKIINLLEYKRKNQMKELNELVKALMASLDPNKANMMKYFTKLSDGSHWFEEYNCSDWSRLEVPGTSYNQFQQPHSWNKVYIESFDNTVLTLTSIRRPKRITLLGSNQKTYMLLVKGGEDVRLDQRVQHLFELVNRILNHNTQTSKKQLEISRFEVVPMKPMFGVFEWVDKSKTLRTFFEAELRELKGKPDLNLSTQNDGFGEFYLYFKRLCPTSDDRHVWHRTLMARPEEQVVKNMNRCEARIPYGLLRFGLEKLAKNYDSFLHIKNKFISNYSAICLITYIFGIGDRHLENFLIQTSTGNLVMIDFGYSFGASIELPIPELIPFRLTKSFRELAAPIGIEGSFKKCLLACFEALNKKLHLIVDYCDVFVDDPLMEWVWVSRRQLNQSASNQVQYISSGNSFSVSQQAPQKKLFSNKIKIVENKLRGHNPRLILQLLLVDSRHKSTAYIESLKKAIWGKAKYKNDILSGEEVINELISLAMDRNIMGRSYIGLNLFI